MALDRSDGEGCGYRARGRELLARTGSLARIAPSVCCGCCPRSGPRRPDGRRSRATPACRARDSRPAGTSCPARHPGTDPQAEHAEMLLLPWPLQGQGVGLPVPAGLGAATGEGTVRILRVRPRGAARPRSRRPGAGRRARRGRTASTSSCCPSARSRRTRSRPGSAAGPPRRDLSTGRRPRARRTPEGHWAATGCTSESARGWRSADRCRAPRPRPPGSTSARTSTTAGRSMRRRSASTTSAVRCTLTSSGGRRWTSRRRSIQFVQVGEEITIVSLVCEDLAQDDVAQIIRSVGPTIVRRRSARRSAAPSRWGRGTPACWPTTRARAS